MTPIKIDGLDSNQSGSTESTPTPKPRKRAPNRFSATTGGGFSTKKKAMKTLQYIKGRAIRYQLNVVTGFRGGAQGILKKAKTKQKKHDIKEAIEVFDGWLRDYEANKQQIESFEHLQLAVIEKYEPLVALFNSERRKEEELEHDECDLFQIDTAYFRALQRMGGEIRALRSISISNGVEGGEDGGGGDDGGGDGERGESPKESISWDIARNHRLLAFKAKLTAQDIRCDGMMSTVDDALLFYKRGKMKGCPSRIHLQMIMYGYSPHKNAIKKLARSVSKIVGAVQDGYSLEC